MKYGQIPGVNKQVSRVMLGSMSLNRANAENSFAILDASLAAGVNAIDLAWVYGGGETERVVGDWIAARKNRDRVVLVDKGVHHNGDRKRVTPYDIEADLHDSLARLRVPSIDVYLLHRDDPAVPVGPIVEALDRLKREGLIDAYGGSNWRHERIQEANDYAAKRGLTPFVASSPNFGLAEQFDGPWEGCMTITGSGEAAAREWYRANQLPVLAYSSLGRGLFSGRVDPDRPETIQAAMDEAARKAYAYPENFERLRRVMAYARAHGVAVPQVALAWALMQPLNVFALVGAQAPGEIPETVKALSLSIPAADAAKMNLEGTSKN